MAQISDHDEFLGGTHPSIDLAYDEMARSVIVIAALIPTYAHYRTHTYDNTFMHLL